MEVTPAVEFNHLYVVLQEETIDQIASSDVVSTRFRIKRETVEADEESWTGTYLSGQRIYLELFAPGGAEGMERGHSGIAFSTRRLGQIDGITERLEAVAPGHALRGLRKARIEQTVVPWFHHLSHDQLESPELSVWLMDFHEDYLTWRGIEVADDGLFDRGSYLGKTQPSHVDDVTEIGIAITADEHAHLNAFLRALEFRSTKLANGTVYRSGTFSLAVSIVANPQYGIRRVCCTMPQSKTDKVELKFGSDACLLAKEGSLTWIFGSVAARES